MILSGEITLHLSKLNLENNKTSAWGENNIKTITASLLKSKQTETAAKEGEEDNTKVKVR